MSCRKHEGWPTPESWMAFTFLEDQGHSLAHGASSLDFLWELEWGQEDDGQSLVLSVVHCPWLV